MADENIVQMPIDQLQANPLQPRGVITPESLVDLVDSIREHGILEPLVVAKTPAGYQIIAGERRWRSAKIVGLQTVPVIVKETSPRGMLEMAIVENVQRVDLNPIERARAFQRLIDEFTLSSVEISKRVGKSQSFVSNSLRLLSLPDAVKDGILSGLITEGHARALAQIGDSRLMIEAYKIVLRESASVRRAEDLARRMKAQQGIPLTDATSHVISEETDKIRKEMEDAIVKSSSQPTRSKVKLVRSRRETRLTISLYGNLEQTEERLQKIYKALCS
ncbi:stage 0 sporulation protein J [Candidatus Shapirobacteria bacterium CG09_land_8_20_14_0_10_39_12]|uniref:Stage 0 sporulation protein J n=1 Tax=Candidatus Shapirobacteria bacterium CG09_land_8_20_14_0_10_39_12 TaxID=1974885 RepID=A0A2H0WNU4_9BACT|nr:MAG: stage 0 sporulation protein J [Candidatus Shapirobacteria bacterium CG09_land_8_20_14_0_10_39_12]